MSCLIARSNAFSLNGVESPKDAMIKDIDNGLDEASNCVGISLCVWRSVRQISLTHVYILASSILPLPLSLTCNGNDVCKPVESEMDR